MYIKAFGLAAIMGAFLLAGCAGGGGSYHHHPHKHKYMTKDYNRTYQYPYNRYYYKGHYYPRYHYQKRYHHSHHYRYYHRMSTTTTDAKAKYVHHKHRSGVPKYPYTYHGNKYGGHTRMATSDEYGQGYAAGCRTAHTGMMYKNPKLHSDSQHYQMGWETGFNHCHYDRSYVTGVKDKYSYIPY